jgi:hypothetical protein
MMLPKVVSWWGMGASDDDIGKDRGYIGRIVGFEGLVSLERFPCPISETSRYPVSIHGMVL